MPWVRLDDHAMEHPKVAGLPDGAFRLWVAGLSYCQKYLTDGFISDVALRGLRAFSAKRRDELTTAGLWDDADGGVSVHDYLDWNESRSHVINSRKQAQERLKKHREKRVSNAVTNGVQNAHPTVGGVRGSSQLVQVAKTEGGAGETKPDPAVVSAFMERYHDLHVQYRGVAYLGNRNNDYDAACEMVKAFGAPLCEAIAIYGLNDPDPFMRKSTVTINMLKSRASKYAEELKAKKLA